jgi:hypothetical protein
MVEKLPRQDIHFNITTTTQPGLGTQSPFVQIGVHLVLMSILIQILHSLLRLERQPAQPSGEAKERRETQRKAR